MIKLYDEVALLSDIPEAGLHRGQVGYVVEEFAPEVYEVEFSDKRNGVTYAMLPLRQDQLLVLHFTPFEVESRGDA